MIEIERKIKEVRGGATSRNRTGKPLRAVDFESTASTNSAKVANRGGILP